MVEVRVMRILLLMLLFSATASAQTRDELHSKYGAPASETFLYKPGIFIITTYSKTG